MIIDSEQFVNLIRYAKYICTDSFHCTVFSILHHKQFLAFDRYSDPLMMSRNSRIANLCDITGLSSRRYTGECSWSKWKSYRLWQSTNERLEKEKAISVAYIREALGRMIEINDKVNCSGCTACYAVCPQSAIEMKLDEEGFKYPG